MDSSQIGWLQGEISKIIPLLVSTSSCSPAVSSEGGLLPTKTIRNVSGLISFGSVSFGDSALAAELSIVTSSAAPTAILCFYIFISQSKA